MKTELKALFAPFCVIGYILLLCVFTIGSVCVLQLACKLAGEFLWMLTQ